MMTHDEMMAAALAELSADFRNGLRADLDGLSATQIALESGMEALRDLAHRHAGSAASFGFPSLSDAARAAESALKQPGPHTKDAVAAWMAEAQAIAA
jgi:HPt (histidine-containing phosphotransfer) domain-containing protein